MQFGAEKPIPPPLTHVTFHSFFAWSRITDAIAILTLKYDKFVFKSLSFYENLGFHKTDLSFYE
jgi:hypothetical protein